ncbi:hypothetical protein M3936_05675 [Sutcliffiella horikoshii]|uniref:hypothetical protein n=1 Tax=Sutcliffiella horikoshii TaxID=79883 RepID=UPI00203DDDBF|nr:hypothetical protein [Sutcliffiella horikoshii]MCM3617074.1 hypothetical protein [Sutcliffiella horikoshii]
MNLMIILIPVVILLLVFLLIGFLISKGSITFEEKRSAGMIRVVYYYLILFMTLMMTIGGSVAAFMAIADIVSPSSYHQTYSDYKEMKIANKTKFDESGKPISGPEIDEDELLAEYNAVVAQEKERNREMAWNSLIKSFGWIIIPLPIFIFYQRKVRRNE